MNLILYFSWYLINNFIFRIHIDVANDEINFEIKKIEDYIIKDKLSKKIAK